MNLKISKRKTAAIQLLALLICGIVAGVLIEKYVYRTGSNPTPVFDNTVISNATWVNSTNINIGGVYLNGLNRTDAVANPISTVSYIIYPQGLLYLAKNGTTGQIDYRGTDVGSVITSIIAGFPSAGGDIKLEAGVFSVSTSILINPQVAQTITLEGAGQGEGDGTTLYLSGASSSPVIYVPSTANSGLQLNIRDLNVKVDTTYQGRAIFVNASCNLDFSNLWVRSNTFKQTGTGAVGIQLGQSSHTLSGDMKILDTVTIAGFVTGIICAADWVDMRSVCTWYSNKAAFDFEGAPIKPIMNRCHAYLSGGPYVIYDNRSVNAGSAYTLDIVDFYSEAAGTQAGYNSVTSIYYAVQSPWISVSDFSAYTDWGVAVPPEYGGTTGTPLNYQVGNQNAVIMPTTTTDWNRNTWSNTPSSINIGTSYRNVNMATMHITVNYDLPPAAGTNTTVILGMYNINPSGGVYTIFYAKASSMIGQPYAIDGQLTLDVPPGWWFSVSANLQNMITGYTITYTTH